MPVAAFVINRTLLRDPRGFLRCCGAAAKRHGWEPWFAETGEAEGGLAVTRRVVAAGARLVFAAGGDGTVRACAEALAGTGVPLAIVPLGTANLTARALGVPGRADRAIDAGFGGRDRRIDLGRWGGTGIQAGAGGAEAGGAGAGAGGAGAGGAGAGGAGAGGAGAGAGADWAGIEAGGGVFTAMAGIGLDAAVVGAAPQHVKRRLGWMAYAVSGVTQLWWPARDFTVRLDDGEPLRRRARCVVVGNAGLLPGGFILLPGARIDDGRLDVGILAPSGPWGWARVAGRVLARSARQDGPLERFQARRVLISAEADLPRQVDGEIIAPGRTLGVSVGPHALTVRQPR